MSGKLFLLLLGALCLLSDAICAPANWLPGYRLRMVVEVTGDDRVWESGDGWVVANLPTGGWCRPDGADIQVQDAGGGVLPVQVISSNPEGNTIIQFKSANQAREYWVYMGNALASTATRISSGQTPTLEVRPFPGDQLDTWPEVMKALQAISQIQGNALIPNVRTYGNPFHAYAPGNFAAVYRGCLKIETAGPYRFSVNAEDASFLFLNRQLVYQQPGKRTTSRSVKDWYEIDLKPGLVPFEYFHISGSGAKNGAASLVWKAPGMDKWDVIPAGNFLTAPFAVVRAVEGFGAPAAAFVWGVEDAPVSPEAGAYLVRFQAHGNFVDPAVLRWDFGDGTTGSGASVRHVYFDPGEYLVTLHAGNLPPFRQRIYVSEPPSNSGPASLREVVEVLSRTSWKTMNPVQLDKAFDFLIAAGQPGQWKLQAAMAGHLLARKDVDPPRKARLYDALLEAMAEDGRAAEAVKLSDKMLAELAKPAGLRLQAMRSLARIHWKYLRNFKEASALYEQIFEENQRVQRPELRRAAIEWGDMFLESGDLNQAEERYRLASTLGGEQFAATGQIKAIGRGALLRVAEQQLRAGNIRESRALLERIEMEYPEQKIEGLFRFLRAEVDRNTGEYRDAIENYQVLLKLSQWSSYRDRALAGIALSYNELGEFNKAAELLKAIKESFPEYYTEAKLDAVMSGIEDRLARKESGKPIRDLVGFKGYASEFNQGFKETSEITGLEWKDGLGIYGTGLAEIFQPAPKTAGVLSLQLDQVRPKGRYWVEIWYREQGVGVVKQGTAEWVVGLDPPGNPPGSQARQFMDPSFGQWRKLGVMVDAPDEVVAQLNLRMVQLSGCFQFDGLRVLPVSEREEERLRNFIQGDAK